MNRPTALAAAIIAASMATQAQALNNRTWVSGKGSDVSGCGPITTPCRTLQYAHDVTASGGEIDVLDSAGYGALSINKAITVVNNGGIAGVLAPAGGNGILVNAGGSDNVVLRGLTVEGANVGAVGILFRGGRSLIVADSLVQGFVGTGYTGTGIQIRHTSGSPRVTVSNTTVANNQYVGLHYIPGGNGGGKLIVSESTAIGNEFGFYAYAGDSTGESDVVFYKSKALNNVTNGFGIRDDPGFGITGWIESCFAAGSTSGFQVLGTPKVTMSHTSGLGNETLDFNFPTGAYMQSGGHNVQDRFAAGAAGVPDRVLPGF